MRVNALEEVLKAPMGAHIPAPDLRIVQRQGWYQVFSPQTWSNEIMRSVLPPDADVEAVLDRVAAEYAEIGTYKWCTDPTTRPLDLGSRLERRGFETWGMAGMVCRPSDLRLAPVTGVTVERVEDAEAYGRACADAWEIDTDEMIRNTRWILEAGTPHHLFIASVDGEPAGTGATFLHPDSGYLIGAAVKPSMRGRGVYRALIEARLRHLEARGYTLATTWARSATSAPILNRLGFETLFEGAMYRSP